MEDSIAGFLASFILVLRNALRLITDPYKTMRTVAKEHDPLQIIIILTISCLYFAYAASIRNSTINPFVISHSALVASSVFLTTYILSLGLLYSLGRLLRVDNTNLAKSLCYLSAYSLLPAFFWFICTSTLFMLFPPPRQATALGGLFSVIFIVYSLTLLFWRFVLLYLTIRFSFRSSFSTTVSIMMIYVAWLLPYAYMLYVRGLFRVPFI